MPNWGVAPRLLRRLREAPSVFSIEQFTPTDIGRNLPAVTDVEPGSGPRAALRLEIRRGGRVARSSIARCFAERARWRRGGWRSRGDSAQGLVVRARCRLFRFSLASLGFLPLGFLLLAVDKLLVVFVAAPRHLGRIQSGIARAGSDRNAAPAAATAAAAAEIAEALAQRLGPIEPTRPEDPNARLSGFANPKMADFIETQIEDDAKRITLNPDCGFAPGSAADVSLDEVYTKLKNEVAAAKRLREKYC
jgi:hypothetical protein